MAVRAKRRNVGRVSFKEGEQKKIGIMGPENIKWLPKLIPNCFSEPYHCAAKCGGIKTKGKPLRTPLSSSAM